jgi:outer membrane biosynthesis protein TonB
MANVEPTTEKRKKVDRGNTVQGTPEVDGNQTPGVDQGGDIKAGEIPSEPSEPNVIKTPELDVESEIKKEINQPVTEQPVRKKPGRKPGQKNKPKEIESQSTEPKPVTDIDRQLSKSIVLMYEQLLKQACGESGKFDESEKQALVESWTLVSAQYDMSSKNAPIVMACIVTAGLTVGKVLSPDAVAFRKERRAKKVEAITRKTLGELVPKKEN